VQLLELADGLTAGTCAGGGGSSSSSIWRRSGCGSCRRLHLSGLQRLGVCMLWVGHGWKCRAHTGQAGAVAAGSTQQQLPAEICCLLRHTALEGPVAVRWRRGGVRRRWESSGKRSSSRRTRRVVVQEPSWIGTSWCSCLWGLLHGAEARLQSPLQLRCRGSGECVVTGSVSSSYCSCSWAVVVACVCVWLCGCDKGATGRSYQVPCSHRRSLG